MRQLVQSEYRSHKSSDTISVTLNHTGTISFNRNAVKHLDIEAGDRVIITSDENNEYFVGKAKSNEDKDAFLLRASSGATEGKYLQFNCSAIIAEMVGHHDLALSKEKKKSIRFEIDSDPIDWNKIKLYQIKLS